MVISWKNQDTWAFHFWAFKWLNLLAIFSIPYLENIPDSFSNSSTAGQLQATWLKTLSEEQ